MPDVVHDPATDWCACEPDGPDRCGYRLLADTVIAKLGVDDGDAAEVALCMDAVERAADFIRAQPCHCWVAFNGNVLHLCVRCSIVGRPR